MKSEFDLNTTTYAIDVNNHYENIRVMFTLTLDSIEQNRCAMACQDYA